MLYSYIQHADSSLNKTEKELFFSIQKTYDLYHFLLTLVLEIADYANGRIEIAKQKRIPTREDLHPNSRFVDNKIIQQLRVNKQLNQYLNNNKLSWVNNPGLIKRLHNHIRMNQYFKSYMEDPEPGYEKDKKLIIDIYTNDIANFESIYQYLEEESIYWNDEVDFVISMITKTIKNFKPTDVEFLPLMPLYKSDEDKEYVKVLFRKTLLRREEYRQLIKDYIENWDIERVALIDFLILEMAITEAVEFSSIPTRVTINEYIEIAKYYSTSKSGIFVNGLLDKIFKDLKQKEIIKKTGRGLIGEVN